MTEQAELDGVTCTLVDSREGLDEMLTSLREWSTAWGGPIGFDTESHGVNLRDKDMLNVHRSTLTGYSLSVPGLAWYVPVAHREQNAPPEYALRALEITLNELPFEQVVGHNLKWDVKVLRREGVTIPREKLRCTQVLAFMCEAGIAGHKRPLSLKTLAPELLGVEMESFEDTTDSLPFDLLLPKEGYQYACRDAYAASELYTYLKPQADVRALWGPYLGFEMPLVSVLADMELAGMHVDREQLRALWEEAVPVMEQAQDEFRSILGDPDANINSSNLMQEMFSSGVWSVVGVAKTATGRYKVDSETLLGLSKRGSEKGRALASAILRFKDVSKIASTYSHTLIDDAEQYPDCRLHGNFNQTVARTGRLSSSNPNLQNIPVRTDLGKRVREAFCAPPGYAFTSADYSQIELRVLAHLAGDGPLRRAYQNGEDVHQQTADAVGCDRSQGKTCNFAFVYGAGPRKMAQTMGVSYDEAKRFMAVNKKLRAEVVRLQSRMVRAARSRGYIKTPTGRYRTLDKIDSPVRWERARDERRACNTPVQGLASDIVKIAMVRISERFREDDEGFAFDCRMVCQVHDEIIVEHLDSDLARTYVRGVLKIEMESAYELDVPLVVDPASGYNWSELK